MKKYQHLSVGMCKKLYMWSAFPICSLDRLSTCHPVNFFRPNILDSYCSDCWQSWDIFVSKVFLYVYDWRSLVQCRQPSQCFVYYICYFSDVFSINLDCLNLIYRNMIMMRWSHAFSVRHSLKLSRIYSTRSWKVQLLLPYDFWPLWERLRSFWAGWGRGVEKFTSVIRANLSALI